MKLYSLLFTALCMVIFFITACEKEEDVPDYVGTWIATGSFTEEEVTLEMKDILTLKTSSLTEVLQIKNPLTDNWLDYLGLKGSLTVSDNTMSIVLNELGMSSFDMMTGMPTGNITYYSKEQNEFDQLISESGMPETYSAQFSVSGGSLTFKVDINEDGDFDDEGEVTIYTKQ
jgi:hypothetical protein